MSMRLAEYWREIRERREDLEREYPSGAVPLIQLARPGQSISGGALVWCATNVAAKNLVDNTHRIASEGEVISWRETQRIISKTVEAAEERIHGRRRFVVEVRGQ